MKEAYAKYLLFKSKEGYNKIARDFADTRQYVWPETRFLFQKYIQKGDRILDLGCGNGRYYGLIEEQGAHYFGIDSSDNLIKIAKDQYPKARFRRADALNLPFEDNYFDKVFSIAVLHQVPSKDLRLRFLREAKRVLRPRGLLVLTVWKLGKVFPGIFKYIILRVFRKSGLDYRDILWQGWNGKVKRYYHCFSKRGLRRLVKKAGFKVLEMGTTKNKKNNRQNIFVVLETQ